MKEELTEYLKYMRELGVDYLDVEQGEFGAKMTLDELKESFEGCRDCPLHKNRTNLVFGEGDENAGIVFIGEAPGRNEDLEGRPFVGKAGKQLTDIIEKGMKLKRSDVYICNILKCRPPNNRNPRQEEIEKCSPYLMKQLEIIEPEVIVTLGTFATQTLLDTSTPISKLRGSFHKFSGIKVMPTYHPAYLLRSPSQKEAVWKDIKKVMDFLGLDYD